MNTGVYRIRNIFNNDCYVGSTIKRGFNKRKYEHFNKLKRKSHHSIILQRAYEKYNSNNFVFEILEECPPERCIEREQYYLDTLNSKYNVRKIADSNFSLKHTEEFKKKMSKLRMGNKNPFYGKKHSEDTKRKISDFLMGNQYSKGNKFSEETRQKMSKFRRGKHCSEETKQKLKNVNIGDKNPNYGKSASLETRQKISFSLVGIKHPNFSGYYRFKNSLTGEEIIYTKFGFSDDYKLDRSGISKLCNGKIKSYKKWICIGKEESYEI